LEIYILLAAFIYFVWMICHVINEEIKERDEDRELEEHTKNGTLPFL
jgi:hypothetical protein